MCEEITFEAFDGTKFNDLDACCEYNSLPRVYLLEKAYGNTGMTTIINVFVDKKVAEKHLKRTWASISLGELASFGIIQTVLNTDTYDEPSIQERVTNKQSRNTPWWRNIFKKAKHEVT